MVFSCNVFFCSGAMLLWRCIFVASTCCNHWWKGRTACLPRKLRILQGNPSVAVACGHATSFPASGHKENIQCRNAVLHVQSMLCTPRKSMQIKTRIDDRQQLMFGSTTTSLQAQHESTIRDKQWVTIGNAATEKPLEPFSMPRLWQSDSSLATLTP